MLVHRDLRGEAAPQGLVAVAVLREPRVALAEGRDDEIWRPDPGREDLRGTADLEVQAADGDRVRRGRREQVDIRAARKIGPLLSPKEPTASKSIPRSRCSR